MKPYVIILLFLASIQFVKSQECNCQKDFEFVANYYEENLPGFSDNVNDSTIKEYTKFKNQLFNQSKKYCSDEDLCFKTLLVFVEFFKDNHSSIYANTFVNVDENKKEEVDQFLLSDLFKNREIITDINSTSSNSIQHIENQYQTKDAAYTVAIVKSKNEFRDYAGVIIDSKTPLWKKGQVKFELKKVKENTYDMFTYMRNHSLQYYKNVKLTNGILNNGWYNTNLKERKSYNIDVAHRELTFKELDKETNYMYTPTFSGNWLAKISEFYKQHDATIQAKPYLIIDVRNNGGGSDACVYPLLKYMYTKPFQSDKVDVYATKENIRKSLEWYNSMKKDTVNFSKEFLNGFAKEIETMKSVPNKTFISRSLGQTVTLDTILSNPKKIVIIANKYCASSCETLLFWAMESDKTIIVGENSGGYVGYGEISGVNTPNFNFELGCTMTRYNHQRKYEVDGIPPNYYLNNDKDWITQAVEIIKKD
ncbi:S41 family peptidase [Kordia sp.]|uniref:S41 family peptidase n=1 Tax=Kordia sp. TaxID=1965332 RepID=UPI003B5ABF7E